MADSKEIAVKASSGIGETSEIKPLAINGGSSMIKRLLKWFVRRFNAKHDKEWEEAVRKLHRKRINRRFLS